MPDFYGFRGERPFESTFERQDYSGFQSLKCLKVTVSTQAAAPKHLSSGWISLVEPLGLAGVAIPQRARFQVSIPGEDIVALIWKDNRNQTFASGPATVSILLDRELAEASSAASGRYAAS